MEESIKLINKQMDVQLEKLRQTESQLAIYQRELDDYGFTFDDKGNIKNYKEIMEFYRSTDDVEEMLKVTEEYFALQGELRDITSDYTTLQTKIKNAYKEQLNTTQKIESELTNIIKEEYEKRKKEAEEYAEEYANTRIKMLEEERKAYQAMRDAQNYDESVEDQLKEIEVLRKQIETAKRDTSISGQKRLSELTKELAEAEKRLADITQEQIDKDFDSNITDEIDKIESEKEQILDALEKEFDEKLSEENIAKIVQEALSSGFIELNGEIQSIQSLLLNSINESADGYSAMAEVIKNELVTNLNIALDTMRELENINSALGLQNFDIAKSVSTMSINMPEHSSNSGNSITIGDTNITVTGSVDDLTLAKIEEMIQDSQDKMLNEITANL
jgi:DNA repair exonuclease SbcCD ATPase subunit